MNANPTSQSPPGVQVEISQLATGRATVLLSGDLEMRTMGRLWANLDDKLSGLNLAEVDVDASSLKISGSSGMALLHYLKTGGFTPNARVQVRGLNEESNRLMEFFSDANVTDQKRPRSGLSLPEEIAEAARIFAGELREDIAFIGRMSGEVAAAVVHRQRLRWPEIKRLCVTAGANALPIVSLLSFLIGLMIAFEGTPPLAQFGAQIFVADMVGYGAVRELGPMMTAIMLAGRSGAAFAAELGTMKVDEELDALTTMGLDPIRFLALQRVVASILLTPLLTVYTMFAGLLGGTLVMLSVGFPIATIYQEMATRVHLQDISVGLGKSVVFGAIFSAVGCLRGFQTGEGPIAVGLSATRAVVSGIFLIILADTLFAGTNFLLS